MGMQNGMSSIWEIEKLGNICERLLFRLNSRTKGLLEVPGVYHRGTKSRLNPEILEQDDECSSSSERHQTSSDEDNESPSLDAAECWHQVNPQEATTSRKRKRDEQGAEALPAFTFYDSINRGGFHVSTESTPLKVEISNHSLESWNPLLLKPQIPEEALCSMAPADLPQAPLNPYEDMDITYLHRTARDYLEQQTVWADLMTHTNGTGFSPHTALLMGSVIFVKSAGHKNRHAVGMHDRSWQTLGSDEFYELAEGHAALSKELDRALNFQWGFIHSPDVSSAGVT